MARSISLAAYLAFARREPATLKKITVPRPGGELVWLHCADPARARALAQLALRLSAQRTGVRFLLTTSPGTLRPDNLPSDLVWMPCPSENPLDIRGFLDHWRPDLMIWLGPWLRPALIDAAHGRGIATLLLEADTPGLENRRWRWMPEPTRATLARFTAVLTLDKGAADRFRRILPDGGPNVIESGKLLEESHALPCNETDLEDLRAALGGRPVWLAARVQPQEIPLVLQAYRAVLRLSHRMLLIVVPDRAEDFAAIRTPLAKSGLRLANWDDGVFPDDNTHVLLAESPSELGLWYRAAPVTLMGSSLAAGHGGRDPLEPAALGSAVLYGPGVRWHLDAYSRLAQAGGARIVKDSDSLTAAVTHLIAPDEVAAMAHAGWQIVSEGAEVSDQIVALAQDLLDTRGKPK